ncbi:MAG: NTP transferase domain-containing protein [Candidatus Paceibacterota bacterium]|jgi:choline kinase
MSIDYIVIQAGGGGTRLQNFTQNKPKAMISVKGNPLIINTMKLYPKAHFIIIGDYKYDVLEKYLKLFASNYKYTLIRTNEKGTCSGINEALKLIKPNTPFMLLWCDLFFEEKIFPNGLDVKNNNYIGLSKDFYCRWCFDDKKPKEEASNTNGIAGVFIFKNKRELKDVPLNDEFCKHLERIEVPMKKFYLKGAMEVGTFDVYKRIIKEHLNIRPFNSIIFNKKWVIKKPIDEQGKELSIDESAWYKYIKNKKLDFIPKLKSFKPITLQRINGNSIFNENIDNKNKLKLINQMIDNLKKLHTLESRNLSLAYQNNKNAILIKTKKRLDSVISLIPYSDDDFIIINNKKCINFYKYWDKVEKICEPYLLEDNYVFIHGDPTFSNTLYDSKKSKTYLIDPRGYYGDVKLLGDEDYDWAKLYYSIVGDYDQFNSKNFTLVFNDKGVNLDITSNGWGKFEDNFLKKIKRNKDKIKIFHAIIWLSLTSYTWDDYDSICGAFYKGIYLMQECYERTL